MDVKKTIDIGLDEYGIEGGMIVMGKPTFRRLNQMKNDVGQRSKGTISRDGTQEFVGALTGDMDIIYTLAYVRTAPFNPTVEGFLAFCDKLDDIEVGFAEEVWNKMTSAIAEIAGGENSPFVPSPAAEKETSE